MAVSSSSLDVGVSFCDTLVGDRDLDSPEKVDEVQGVGCNIAKPGQGMVYVYDGLRCYEALAMCKELY
jgi:hypothetical protein